MKIVCSKTKLTEAIGKVSGAVSQKSTLPVLEGILFKAEGTGLTLTAYDLEMGISTAIQAEVEQSGELVLSSKLFGDMIRRLPDDRVVIESDDRLLTTIRCGKVEYTVLGMPASDFPELPSVFEEDSAEISGAVLKSMIEMTRFAVSASDAKPVHTGSMFDILEDEINLVSVDGYRLARRTEKIATGKTLRFIVPGKTLSEVSKLLKEDDIPIKILLSRKHCMFLVEDYTVVSRLLEGEFLDYRAAVPASGSCRVTVNTKQFCDSVERTSLLISDRLKSPLKISFSGECINISASTALGKAHDEIPCVTSGEGFDMGFNHKYLSDALRAACSEKILLEINGPVSPMKIMPENGESFVFLVLPVRLKND